MSSAPDRALIIQCVFNIARLLAGYGRPHVPFALGQRDVRRRTTIVTYPGVHLGVCRAWCAGRCVGSLAADHFLLCSKALLPPCHTGHCPWVRAVEQLLGLVGHLGGGLRLTVLLVYVTGAPALATCCQTCGHCSLL